MRLVHDSTGDRPCPGPSAAARLLGAASWWRTRRHRPLDRLERIDVDRAEDGARTLLGDTDFQAAYRAGAGDPQAVVGQLEIAPASR